MKTSTKADQAYFLDNPDDEYRIRDLHARERKALMMHDPRAWAHMSSVARNSPHGAQIQMLVVCAPNGALSSVPVPCVWDEQPDGSKEPMIMGPDGEWVDIEEILDRLRGPEGLQPQRTPEKRAVQRPDCAHCGKAFKLGEPTFDATDGDEDNAACMPCTKERLDREKPKRASVYIPDPPGVKKADLMKAFKRGVGRIDAFMRKHTGTRIR